METLTIKSKIKLGCNICDKCCINRGDIKLTPINVIQISKYMNIPIKNFLEKYTLRLQDEEPEIVLKPIGKRNRCILNDKTTNKCTVHNVKPMQCVTFPLIPIDLEHDIFINQDTCVCEEKKEIKVIDWLNGKNGIYVKYKKLYMEWIKLVEDIQKKWNCLNKKQQEDLYEILFCNYDEKVNNIKSSVRKNFKIARNLLKKC